jgi:hypothetical protein
MKTNIKIAVAAIGGLVLGACLSGGDWHRSRRLARPRHRNLLRSGRDQRQGPAGYEASGVGKVRDEIKAHGGRVIAGGYNKTIARAGAAPPNRFLIVQWPNKKPPKKTGPRMFRNGGIAQAANMLPTSVTSASKASNRNSVLTLDPNRSPRAWIEGHFFQRVATRRRINQLKPAVEGAKPSAQNAAIRSPRLIGQPVFYDFWKPAEAPCQGRPLAMCDQGASHPERRRHQPRPPLARPGQTHRRPRSARPRYNWFTEGFDTPVLQDAKALVDELG